MNNEREDHLITRRRMLTLMGGSLMMASAACSDEEVPIDETGPCPPTPENEEGRHFVEHENVRSDLLEGESGVALELWIKIVTARTCTPVADALVNVWSANAAGKYSGLKREGTEGQMFLRGIQRTDAAGFVNFKTIYPGWYTGRPPHVHFRVDIPHEDGQSGRTIHTGQLFFPPDINEALRPVYPDNKHTFINNERDRVYLRQGGHRGIVTLEGSLEAGYAGTATIDVNV